MKKKNRNMLLAVGGIAVVAGLGYYFWKKNQETAVAPTAGFGASLLPGRTWPSPSVVDHRGFVAAGYGR